jgi:hypothetical protein
MTHRTQAAIAGTLVGFLATRIVVELMAGHGPGAYNQELFYSAGGSGCSRASRPPCSSPWR